MSVIPVIGALMSEGLRQRFAQALEHYAAERTRRAVPEITLRRSKYEVDRYRRLMLKTSMTTAGASIDRASSRRVAQTWAR